MYGNTYYKLNVIGFPLFTQLRRYIRDSMNYLVDRQGNILFASENFTDTFSSHYNIINSSDTLYFTFTKMEDNNLSITVPAGNFVTKNYKRTYIMCHNWAQAGTVRTINNRYAENVGLVEETLFFLVEIRIIQ